MKSITINDVKTDGYFTINGKVYVKQADGSANLMSSLDTGTPADIDPARSCLPIDKRAASMLLDRK